MFAVYLC